MAVTKVAIVGKLTEEHVLFAKELIEETVLELEIEEDIDELFQRAVHQQSIHVAIARKLVGSKLFVRMEQLETLTEEEKEDAQKQSPDNPTGVSLALADLEGLTMREKIRRCAAAGMQKKDIHKFLGIRAQMVANTLTALAKKDPTVASCKICGRPLRDEESIRDGVGPICSHKQ